MWDLISCPRCSVTFDKATAVDEMFVNGSVPGYAQWTGGVAVGGMGECLPGDSVLLNVYGRIERAYTISAGATGSYLAGGLSATFMSQGYVMVAVAPDSGIRHSPAEPVKLVVTAAGPAPRCQILPPYKGLLLEARMVAIDAPKLTPILAVAALDLFFEELSGGTIETGRPGVWDRLYRNSSGTSLKKVLGDEYSTLGRLLGVRDSLAHGRDHLPCLPENLHESEEKFIAHGHLYDQPLAPSARFAISQALRTIRLARKHLSGT